MIYDKNVQRLGCDEAETKTRYSVQYALGRSCRFLQPHHAIINEVANGRELARIRAFIHAAAPRDRVFQNFLLLNERGDTGERFWNLLRMAVS